MGWAVANYDYAANQPNQLSLERGDRVAIINKAGDSRGWWKGQIHGRVRAKHTHLLQNSLQFVLLKVVLNRGRKIVTPLAESQRDMMAFVLV